MAPKGIIAVASDHGGFALKSVVTDYLAQKGLEYRDFGCFSAESCDYPLLAAKAARAVRDGKCAMGILICSTGVGMDIAANKFSGVRCALCADAMTARLAREKIDANMLALGAGMMGSMQVLPTLDAFLFTPFEGGERHARRVEQLRALEREALE